jgi:hypothetical protein
VFNYKEMNLQKAVNHSYPETKQTYLSLELPITSLLSFHIIPCIAYGLRISPSRKLVSRSLDLNTLDLHAPLSFEQSRGCFEHSFLADRHVSGCRTRPEAWATILG